MNEQVQQALCALVAEHGAAVAADAERCEALLRERCPANKRERALLLGVLRSGVMSELLRPVAGAAAVGRVGTLARRVEDEMGVKADAARWAVESWALALGWPLAGATPMAAAVVAAPVRTPAPAPAPRPAPEPARPALAPAPEPASVSPPDAPAPALPKVREPAALPVPDAAPAGAPRRADGTWIAAAVAIAAAVLFALWRWLRR